MDLISDGFPVGNPVHVGVASPDLVVVTRWHDHNKACARSPTASGGSCVVIQTKSMHVGCGKGVCRILGGLEVAEPLALPDCPHAVGVGVGEREHGSAAPTPGRVVSNQSSEFFIRHFNDTGHRKTNPPALCCRVGSASPSPGSASPAPASSGRSGPGAVAASAVSIRVVLAAAWTGWRRPQHK